MSTSRTARESTAPPTQRSTVPPRRRPVAPTPAQPHPSYSTVWRPGDEKPSQRVQRPTSLPSKRGQRRARKRRWPRFAVVAVVLTVLLVVLVPQITGGGGASTADLLRAVIGPENTVKVEAKYLGAIDTLHGIWYRFSGQKTAAPWQVTPATPQVPVAHAQSLGGGTAAVAIRQHSTTPIIGPLPPPSASVLVGPPPPQAMALPSIAPLVTPALDGEGVWTTAGMPTHGTFPILAKTYLRPDPVRPWAVATILQVDLRYARLHMVAGISQPGGPVNMVGTGLIPTADYQGDTLLAVFNGGFKYADGAYGMMINGTVYVPPVWNAATIAVTKSGQVLMGPWGTDKRFTGANANFVAWRQNGSLLVDHGQISPLTDVGAAWGQSIMDTTYTWRSGIGVTARGTLIYVGGNALSAATLAQTLRSAGAVMAMQLDINPFWVRAFLYSRDASNQLSIARLNPDMQGTGWEYVNGDARDFFYVTRAGG